MDYTKILEDAIDEFYKMYNYERIPNKIVWTENIFSTYLELETNIRLKRSAIKQEDFFKNTVGAIILPNKIGDISYILLNNHPELKYSLEFIRIAIHELTHIHDSIDFAKEYCNSELSLIDKHELKTGEYIWSEFHANFIGYCFFL